MSEKYKCNFCGKFRNCRFCGRTEIRELGFLAHGQRSEARRYPVQKNRLPNGIASREVATERRPMKFSPLYYKLTGTAPEEVKPTVIPPVAFGERGQLALQYRYPLVLGAPAIVPLNIRFPRVEGGPPTWAVLQVDWKTEEPNPVELPKTFPTRVFAFQRIVPRQKKNYSLSTWFPRVWGGPLYGAVPQLRLAVNL
jgi:hypothetical protein